LSCFISGLKPGIKREVQAFQPTSLSHAISLARLQEDKLNDRSHLYPHRRTETTPTPTPNIPQNTERPNPNPRLALTTTPTNPPATNTNCPAPTIRRLSLSELQARRDRGLCYNCDELYFNGHRCKRQFHLLIVEPDEPDDADTTGSQLLLEHSNPTTKPSDPQPDPTPAQISLHALMGHTIPQTLRVMGLIGKHSVSILIDSGSTHKFIQDRTTRLLGLTRNAAQSFQVLVGNREELKCESLCEQIPLQLGTNKFLVDLFVLPLSGAEIFLGVQWLRTLGLVLTDHNTLTMKFIYEDRLVQLPSRNPPSLLYINCVVW